jgi:hypothetical protein
MLWLSRIAAVGSGPRPSARRTIRRSLSCNASSVPSLVHRWYHLKTLDHGPNSRGSDRHATPVLVRYRIALSSSRAVCRGSCSGGNQAGPGMSSFIKDHSASVRSLGYCALFTCSCSFTRRLQPPMERNGQISCGTPSEARRCSKSTKGRNCLDRGATSYWAYLSVRAFRHSSSGDPPFVPPVCSGRKGETTGRRASGVDVHASEA